MYHDKMDQRGTKEGPKRDQRGTKDGSKYVFYFY